MPSRFDRPLRTVPLRFFDLETTGLRPDRGARIAEMAVVDEGGVRFDWVSAHDSPRDEAVAFQLPRLMAHLEDGIAVGHNLSFDWKHKSQGHRGPHPRGDRWLGIREHDKYECLLDLFCTK